MSLFSALKNAARTFRMADGATPHDAGAATRRQKTWMPSSSGPRFEHANLPTLRNRSRDLYRNNPIARGMINMLVADTVVGGIRPILPSLHKSVITAYNKWGQGASPFAPYELTAIQSQVMRTMIVDGGVLVHLFNDNDGTPALRIIEIDCLAESLVSKRKGNTITGGVETDIHGKRLFYHIYTNHPGDGMGTGEVITVPANEIRHIFRPDRPGQIHGLPWLTPAMSRLKLIDDLDDAQLERQRIANLYAGFIVKNEASAPMQSEEPAEKEQLSLEPGIMQELYMGEDIRFSAPPPPMSDYPDYLQTEISLVCAAIGVPHQLLTGQFGGANDRVMRVLMTRYARQIDQTCTQLLIPNLCQPTWEYWLKKALLSGEINAPLAEIRQPNWPVPTWEYMHPVQDIDSLGRRMELGLAARHDLIMQQGGDPAHIDEAIAADPIQQAMMATKTGVKIPPPTP